MKSTPELKMDSRGHTLIPQLDTLSIEASFHISWLPI